MFSIIVFESFKFYLNLELYSVIRLLLIFCFLVSIAALNSINAIIISITEITAHRIIFPIIFVVVTIPAVTLFITLSTSFEAYKL